MRWFWVISGVALLGLGACSSTKETLGLSRQAPDEFTVVTQRPLSVPPNFTLIAPGSAPTTPQNNPVSQQAADAVLGDQPIAADGLGIQQFAKDLGMPQRNPSIRAQLNTDNQGLPQRDPAFTDRLAVWEKQQIPDPTVDAPQEAKRIARKGKKLDGKNVPTKGGKIKAPLEGIF